MDIGRNIINARKKAKLTQGELAQRLGVQQKDISRWESGAFTPGITHLREICKELEVSADEILELR